MKKAQVRTTKRRPTIQTPAAGRFDKFYPASSPTRLATLCKREKFDVPAFVSVAVETAVRSYESDSEYASAHRLSVMDIEESKEGRRVAGDQIVAALPEKHGARLAAFCKKHRMDVANFVAVLIADAIENCEDYKDLLISYWWKAKDLPDPTPDRTKPLRRARARLEGGDQ